MHKHLCSAFLLITGKPGNCFKLIKKHSANIRFNVQSCEKKFKTK